MNISERDITVIKKILSYCDEIEQAHQEYNHSFDIFLTSAVYRNAVSMCILQIGELSNHLSDEFKNNYSFIPWAAIRGMRNVVAHKYGSIDKETVWETAENDIPDLKEFLKSVLPQ